MLKNRYQQTSSLMPNGRFLIYLLLLLIGINCLSGVEKDIRIASYNLQNYLVMDRSVDGKWRPNYPKPEIEKRALRKAILAARPDIIAVQEIGGDQMLRELQQDLLREGLHFKYREVLEGADPERQIAILSQLPLINVIEHCDLDFKYLQGRKNVSRGLLEATVKINNKIECQLFVVHLKSRWTVTKEDPEAVLQRLREAEACRDRIIARTQDKNKPYYIIMGDFNDHPNSAVFRRFDHRGKLKISNLLPLSDNRNEVWTYFYRKEATYTQVDAIMASPALFRFFKNGRIIDALNPLEGSDHRLIFADFKFSGQER
jgi:endonuclease/exonuclease/phosphatase family metal-dependent hydrolase